MKVEKNKDGSFDLKGLTIGKLMAIVRGIDDLQELKDNGRISPVLADVRDIIKNNPDVAENNKQFNTLLGGE